jgi:hypothetical protein
MKSRRHSLLEDEVRAVTRMATKLEQLCGKISLTVGEKISISITEDEVANIKAQGDRCLIGKIWTKKGVDKEAFIF